MIFKPDEALALSQRHTLVAVGHGNARHELLLAVVMSKISENKKAEKGNQMVSKVFKAPHAGRRSDRIKRVCKLPDGDLILGELRVQVEGISPVVLDEG